jgi:peptidoglycan biosynthesis protein MviN/MurJ (putative lipid II flippase)
MMLAVLAVKLLLVRGQVGPVVRVGLVGVVANTALDALLVGPLGAPGLSLGTSLNQVFVATLLFRSLQTAGGTTLEPGFWRWMVRRIAVALLAGGMLSGGMTMLEPGRGLRWVLVCGVMGGVLAAESWRAGVFVRPGSAVAGG